MARERVLDRRRAERATAACKERAAAATDPRVEAGGATGDSPRSARIEALLDLAEAAIVPSDEARGRAAVVVHVDAAALCIDSRGRSELEDGP